MRRFAIFSDIHGNIRALDAVLSDVDARGVSERYCLGDLVGYGAESPAVVARIRESGIPTIQGNYDEGVGARRGECGCYYATPEAKADGEASYAYTDKVLDDADHEWLAALPGEIRIEERGVRILLAHGSPRKINEYLLPDRTDEQLLRLAQAADADVVCVGHIHIPYHRTLMAADGAHVHYVSSGSVGKPKDGDPRACWVEVVVGTPTEVEAHAGMDTAAECAAAGLWVGTVTHRVEYDVRAAAQAVLAAGLPPRLAQALVDA